MKGKFTLLAALLLSANAFAQHNVTTGGQRYSLLTEGTGAWCPHCSDGAVYVENVLASTPKAVAISVHNNDGMSFADGNVLDDTLNNGWPWGTVDMTWFSGQSQIALNRSVWGPKVNERIALGAKYDLTMTHSYNQSTKTITVNVTGKALEALTGSYVFNVYLTEDSVVGPNGSMYSQANHSTYNSNPSHKYYNKGTTINGFPHKKVLRATLGGPWGTAAATNPAANSSVTKTFTFVVPAQWGSPALTPKTGKMNLVAVVHKAKSGALSNSNYPEVMNTIEAKFAPWNPQGIDNVEAFANLQVYPNPASTVVNVRTILNEPADSKITITNSVGQVMFSKTYAKGGSILAESISVANFANGLYFVNISSNGNTVTEKISISK